MNKKDKGLVCDVCGNTLSNREYMSRVMKDYHKKNPRGDDFYKKSVASRELSTQKAIKDFKKENPKYKNYFTVKEISQKLKLPKFKIFYYKNRAKIKPDCISINKRLVLVDIKYYEQIQNI